MAFDPRDVATRLYAKLQRRAAAAKVYSDAYNGRFNLLFASPQFKKHAMGELLDQLRDNWCAPVADALHERVYPMDFRLEDGSIDQAASRTWRANECDIEVSLAILESIVAGRSYGLVWRPDGATTEITFQTCEQAIVSYVPGKRRVRAYGLQTWADGMTEFAVLFAPDTVYWLDRATPGSGEWTVRYTAVNPLGVVPLVELPNRSRLNAHPRSELKHVLPMQHAVNTLWVHLMTASDAMALPGRAVLHTDRPTREIANDEGEVVDEETLPIEQLRDDRFIWLEGREAQIAEFSAANLSNFLQVIEVAVQHIAAQTRTPPHYLLGQMVNISAEALAAAESGLVARATEAERHFGAALREIMRLAALADGDTARAAALQLGSVVWRDPQFRSEAQYADALTKYKSIGVPDEALWEMIPGMGSDRIARWKAMRDDQAAAIVGGNLADLIGTPPPSGNGE